MKSLIFGLGISGLGVLNFFKEKGISFVVCDENKEKVPQDYFQDYNAIDLKTIEQIIISPGISPFHPFIIKARGENVPVISDLELFKKYANPASKIIGITGSNGKSTTSSLVYHILQASGKKVFLGGNIGISPLNKDALEAEYVVLEVSSFQLEYTDFIFDASVLLNIQADHLAYHGGMEGYKLAKAKILENSNFSLKSFECVESKNLKATAEVSITKRLQNGYSLIQNNFYKDGKQQFSLPHFPMLKGAHNMQNIAFTIALCLDFAHLLPNQIIDGIQSFKPLKHRIEFIKQIEGIDFINDSKATNASSAITALKCFTGKSIFLIAGGRQKEEGIEALFGDPAFKYVKEVLLIGEAAPVFAKKIIEYNKQHPKAQVKYVIAGSLERAVTLSFISAKKNKNSVVLLSPLCASFDQFKSFEERGEMFRNLINKL